MEFCPNCKFMVYTRMTNDTGDEPHLTHFCKNCKWKSTIISTDKPIYIRNYKDDFIADKVLSNKYTIYDVTLPRVELDCANTKCATVADIDTDNTLFVNNIPPDYTDDQFAEIFKGAPLSGPPMRVKLSGALITCSPENRQAVMDSYLNKLVDTNTLTIEPYRKPDKEVLYIKYDPTNMRYLYLCAVCGTSWKKL